jgi:hypothetical protein
MILIQGKYHTLMASTGPMESLFAKSPVRSPAGTATGAAIVLKTKEKERMAMRVLLNILEDLWKI